MTILLLPVAAVIFSFIVSVLVDIRRGFRFAVSKLRDHTTRAALYLAAIAMLIVLKQYMPGSASLVQYFAFSFAGAEVLAALTSIKAALGSSDPLVEAAAQAGTAMGQDVQPPSNQGSPFQILDKQPPTK